MKRPAILQHTLTATLLLASIFGSCPAYAAKTPQVPGETIVMVRHGEKPPGGFGQLSCKGLNRSLALPSLLIGRYGRPGYIYAPDPSTQLYETMDHKGPMYSYLRPLATIEPTAIRLGMPVNTQIGFDQIAALQQALLQPAYAHSLIFVAWEHLKMYDFAQQMLRSHGLDPAQVPDWPNDDYETIYIFHITRSASNATPKVTLEIQKEDLQNKLSDTCPGSQ